MGIVATLAIGIQIASPLRAATLQAPPITVDGATVSVPALQRNNAVFVPVRGVFEKLGATVVYTAPASIVARKDGRDLARMTVGSRSATVAGAAQTLGVAPFQAQGHVMVPLRLVSEAAGATVAYIPSPRAVQITHRTVAAAPAVAAVASAAPVAEEQHGFPWWLWPLIALAILALLLLLMRRRKEPIIRTSGSGNGPKIETRR